MVCTLLAKNHGGRRASGSGFTGILIAVALLFALSSGAYAQLSGSYTIGTGQTYTTIDAFFSALNSQGVNGPVTATVLPGTYTGNISLNAVTGASSTNTITIQGQNVNSCIVEYATNSTNSYVIRLYGADYIRIRDLTLNCTGTYGYGVYLTNQADHNEITGCIVNANPAATSSYSIGILGSGSSYSTTGNNANYNLIENNQINGGYYGIRFNGSSSTTNCIGNEFINNEIIGYYYYGIYAYYQGQIVIEDNTIMDRGGTTSSYGIYTYYNRTGPQVNRNYIRAGYYGIYMYYANQDNSVRGSVSNNMVVMWGSGYNYAIRMYYYPYKMDVDYNSINMLTSSSYGYGIYWYYGSDNKMRNNVIRYDGTYYNYFVYVYSSTSVLSTMDYNVYWAPNNPSGYDRWYYGGTTYTSLTSFKNAVSAQNNNSWEWDPEFIGTEDLHTYSQNLNNAGTPVATTTTDFDGDTRSTTMPDIGADEFSLFAIDAGAMSLIAPVPGCGLGANETLTIGIRNYGTSTIDASVNPISVQVTITGPINQTFSATMTSGTIAPGMTGSFTVTSSLDLSQAGNYTINASAGASGDGNANNNDMKPVDLFVDNTVTTYPYSNNFEANSGFWRSESLGGVDDWEYGTPNYSGTYSITSANSGQKAWMTGLTTTYSNSAHAALLSPCLDMSSLTAPVFQFFANYATEGNYDGWAVEASSNGGASWSRLTPYTPAYNYTSTSTANPVGPPQYASYSNNTWKKYVFQMGAYALNSNVKLRIRFGSDGSVNSYPGVAIDDVAIGDFSQKDIAVTDVVYDNATNYWARRQNANHVIHARIVNMGYENNPSTVSLTYKVGGAPGFSGDGVSQTFTPTWSGSEAWVTFSTQHMPTVSGPIDVYVKAFYTGDQKTTNDMAMTSPVIQPESVYGYEDFNTLTPPDFENGWTVVNVNDDEEWLTEAGNGTGGTTSATYPGDLNTADDWLFTPGALLLAGSSYSFDIQYRSRNGDPQIIELAFGPSPDPNSMTVFATYGNFTNTTFMKAVNQYGVSPTFDTPNIEQMYYVGIHVKSAAGGPVDVDDMKLYDNPFPPPKIAYGVNPIYIDDPTIPITFTGVYKKTGLLTKTFEVVNSTGWYGDPDGDMLWDVNTAASWIDIYKSTPDPLMYLTTNPFTPPWCRQNQTFTMEVNANILSPGTHTGTLDFDAYLYNSIYPRGLRASNAIFSVPVELKLSQAGGSGTNVGMAAMTQTGMDGAGNPYNFFDGQGNLFASVWVTGGVIPTMTITSYPGQLPKHVSRYRYVDHYWTIDAPKTGWTADIEFHYFDSEVQSGGVYDENLLRGMRIAPNTGYWEDPIMGTWSTPNDFYNYVFVQGFNDKNFEGEIAVAHDFFVEMPGKVGTDVPASFTLDQNFPNPFNPTTGIRFGLPTEQHVTLTVMNAMGEEVARLVDTKMDAGFHTATFNADGFPSGMYLYTLKAGNFTQTRTMILNK